VVVATMVLSGCAGIGESYSKQDIRSDALQLLPPGAHNLSYFVEVGDGFNPTMSASVEFRARSGTPKQRYAQYLAIARRHGWKLKSRYNSGTREHYTEIENGHAYLLIRIDVGVVSRMDSFYLVMSSDLG
jgi:hypothetical protein